jgi:hypothetical protein
MIRKGGIPMKHLRMVAVVFAAIGGLNAPYGSQARAEKADAHHEHFASCAKACSDCQIQCDMCFHHCAGLVAEGKKDHAKTMHNCVDCAECCKLAATLTARHSPFSVAACECCAKCCDECAVACEKFKDDKHMADCAKSCRDCAKACRAMIEHMKH